LESRGYTFTIRASAERYLDLFEDILAQRDLATSARSLQKRT
jgi:hypothetical protein